MLIAAVDSTAVVGSVAIAEVEDGILKKYSLFTLKSGLTHSETLLPMLDSALKEFGADYGDIDLYAVSVGPGSFTGVRIGVSTVKGLAFAGNIPCAPVSTLEALSANVSGGFTLALMDARRQQFYCALFADGKRISEDAALGIDEISAMLESVPECTLCGDGARLFASLYKGDCRVRLAPDCALEQNALSVAMCGYGLFEEGKAVSPSMLRPVYLRMPQAERERLEREKGEKK